MGRKFLIYLGGAVLVLGVFTFFIKQTAGAFSSARGQAPIRLFRGRSNFGGVQNRGGYNLRGNNIQQKQNKNSRRLMGRS